MDYNFTLTEAAGSFKTRSAKTDRTLRETDK